MRDFKLTSSLLLTSTALLLCCILFHCCWKVRLEFQTQSTCLQHRHSRLQFPRLVWNSSNTVSEWVQPPRSLCNPSTSRQTFSDAHVPLAFDSRQTANILCPWRNKFSLKCLKRDLTFIDTNSDFYHLCIGKQNQYRNRCLSTLTYHEDNRVRLAFHLRRSASIACLEHEMIDYFGFTHLTRRC